MSAGFERFFNFLQNLFTVSGGSPSPVVDTTMTTIASFSILNYINKIRITYKEQTRVSLPVITGTQLHVARSTLKPGALPHIPTNLGSALHMRSKHYANYRMVMK